MDIDLKTYVDQRLSDLEKRLDQQRDDLKDRLHTMNEVREQLRHQATTMARIDQVETLRDMVNRQGLQLSALAAAISVVVSIVTVLILGLLR